MEKKQNVKQITTEEQIELFWKENPKIPFMQSKEILTYGYKKGIESVIANVTKTNIEDNKQKTESFTGTTKELINYAQNEINQKKDNNGLNRDQINLIKLVVYNSVLSYMNSHQDLICCYSEFKSRQESLMSVLPVEMQRKNNKNRK